MTLTICKTVIKQRWPGEHTDSFRQMPGHVNPEQAETLQAFYPEVGISGSLLEFKRVLKREQITVK